MLKRPVAFMALLIALLMPPSFGAIFVFTPIQSGTQSQFMLSLVSSVANPTLTGIGFTLTLPVGLSFVSVSNSQCGGTVTHNSTAYTLSGGMLPTNGSCNVSGFVTGTIPGTYTVNQLNVTGFVVDGMVAPMVNAFSTQLVISSVPTWTPALLRPDTIGIYSAGTWYLRLDNSTGPADITFSFGGLASHQPVVGDWNGDSIDSVGVFDIVSGLFQLRNTNTTGLPDYAFLFGNPGDNPVAGRWAITMAGDGIGVYRSSNGTMYLRKSLSSGASDYGFAYGNPGDVGVAGNFDPDPLDSPGVYRPSNGHWYLTYFILSPTQAVAAIDMAYIVVDATPFVGDWIGDGLSRTGFYKNGQVFYRNTLTSGSTDKTFYYGFEGAFPVAGHWTTGIGGKPPLLATFSPTIDKGRKR